MRYLGLLIAMVLGTGSAAVAQPSSQYGVLLAESANFAVVCDGGPACGPTATPAQVAARVAEAKRVADKAEKIFAWLNGLGFPELYIDRNNATKKYALSVDEGRFCSRNNSGVGRSLACHLDSNTRCGGGGLLSCREIILPVDGFLSGDFTAPPDPVEGDTLAHEISHALQKIPMNKNDPGWLAEAMGDAFGRAWATKGSASDSGQLLSLDASFYDGLRGGYEKAPYLEFVGRKIGSQDQIAFLTAFFDVDDDGAKGMSYLYDKTGGQKFDALFPEFVARFNNIDTVYIGASGSTPAGAYYDKHTTEYVSIPDPHTPYSEPFPGSAEPFAASARHFLSIKTTPGPEDEPKDLIMGAEFEITKATRIGETQLVYEHKLTKNRRFRFLFGGDRETEGGFLRVTNAGPDENTTTSQTYQVTFRSWPVRFRLPPCVGAGDTAKIDVDGDTTELDNWKLVPAAGNVSGLDFTAPGTAGPVKVRLEITSTITRQEGSLAPKAPSKRMIELGEIDVAREACDIILKISGQPMRMVYSRAGDFTMFDDGRGNQAYIGQGRIALRQNGNWTPIPAAAQAMMLAQFEALANQPADAQRPPWAEPGQDMMGRMPFVLTRWYEWDEMTEFLHPGIPDRRVGTPVTCPTGGAGCRNVTGAAFPGASLTYDDKHRIVEIVSAGQSMTFTYGTAEGMAIPPGW